MARKDNSSTISLADLSEPRSFDLRPDADTSRDMAERLGLLALRKVSFSGELRPLGGQDVELSAKLGATVVQPCGVTLEPVTTRIDEHVERTYVANMPDLPDGAEVEMPGNVEVEPLPRSVDLSEVMEEALSLAIPMFPRSPEAGVADISVTEPGKSPMTDEEARPFAGLAQLRDKLGDKQN